MNALKQFTCIKNGPVPRTGHNFGIARARQELGRKNVGLVSSHVVYLDAARVGLGDNQPVVI